MVSWTLLSMCKILKYTAKAGEWMQFVGHYYSQQLLNASKGIFVEHAATVIVNGLCINTVNSVHNSLSSNHNNFCSALKSCNSIFYCLQCAYQCSAHPTLPDWVGARWRIDWLVCKFPLCGPMSLHQVPTKCPMFLQHEQHGTFDFLVSTKPLLHDKHNMYMYMGWTYNTRSAQPMLWTWADPCLEGRWELSWLLFKRAEESLADPCLRGQRRA